jgi:preprotein translocase subunit SecA
MIGDILKKIFGDKSTKDKKIYWPFVDATRAVESQIKNLSDDQLRAKTREFQAKIRAEKQSLEDELTQLKEKAENNNTSIQEKEDLFDKIDKLEKYIFYPETSGN